MSVLLVLKKPSISGLELMIKKNNFQVFSFAVFFLMLLSSLLFGDFRGMNLYFEIISGVSIMYIFTLISFYILSMFSESSMKIFLSVIGWISILRFIVVGISLVVIAKLTALNIWAFAISLILSYLIFMAVELFFITKKIKAK